MEDSGSIMLFYLLLLASFYLLFKSLKKRLRRSKLMSKYHNEAIVKLIMQKAVCKDMTEDQVKDSLGKPSDIDIKVLKTKTTKIYKYDRVRGNQYRTRIILENDLVVGWEMK